MSDKLDNKIRTGRGGKRPGSGRKKGTPNKVTATLKEMILGALDAKGGQKYLEQQADQNPTAFLQLIGKVLPTTLATDPNNPIEIVATITRRIVKTDGNQD